MLSPGNTLLSAAKNAQREALLIAPFVKTDALGRIIENIPANVSITVVTRWIPGEIASGVCDIEIFDLVSSKIKGSLWVHPLLHAKLYRFDEITYIGSANITGKALGWRAPSNIEILQPATNALQELKLFESELLKSSIRVDVAYRDAMLKQVEIARTQIGPIFEQTAGAGSQVSLCWLPTCRSPEKLWSVYDEGESAQRRMVQSAYEAALADLEALNVMKGLQKDQFNKCIAAMLGQMPLVRDVEIAAMEGLSSEAGTALIEKSITEAGIYFAHSANEMWEVLQTWLGYFFPEMYRTEAATTVLRHGRILK